MPSNSSAFPSHVPVRFGFYSSYSFFCFFPFKIVLCQFLEFLCPQHPHHSFAMWIGGGFNSEKQNTQSHFVGSDAFQRVTKLPCKTDFREVSAKPSKIGAVHGQQVTDSSRLHCAFREEGGVSVLVWIDNLKLGGRLFGARHKSVGKCVGVGFSYYFPFFEYSYLQHLF